MRHILLLPLLTACGSPATQSGEAAPGGTDTSVTNHPTSFYVATPDDRPACDAYARTELVYVESTKQFYTCNGTSWVEVEVKGKDGKDGEQGAAGKDGKDGVAGVDGKDGASGKDGTDNHIKEVLYCHKLIDVPDVILQYNSVIMASGDRFVSASVATAYAESSHTAFYNSAQTGAHVGSVSVVSDVYGTSGWGGWIFTPNAAGDAVDAAYNDAELGGTGEDHFPMLTSDCQKHVY